MNIGMIVYSHYSRDARVRRYAESLARKGFKVDVISLTEDYQPKSENISLIKYLLPRRRYGKFWYILEYLLFFLYSLIILSSNYFVKHYKIIHIHNMPDFLVFSAIIPKLLGAKIILDMHDPMPELYMTKYHTTDNDFIFKLLKLQEKACFAFADKIITANEEFKKMFVVRNPQFADKISVILNCPDPLIFNPQATTRLPAQAGNSQIFTLLYMGTVEKRFGLDIVIDAIPEIAKKIPNIKFTIIPKLEEEGEYFKNLKLKIKNLKVENIIHFLPPLPLEKIAQEIRKADIGIVLAINGVFTQSIFPVKLLEFVQMGIPVIATKTKILSQYFTDKQIYFLEKNAPKEFLQAIFTIYQNKILRKNLSQNAKEYLQKYNWEKEEKKYLDIIKNL